MVLYYFYSCADATTSKMKWDLGIYEDWRNYRNFKCEISAHPKPKYILTLLDLVNNHQEMCDVICMVLSEVKKRNREEYPASSLSNIIVMLNVYMKKQEVDVNLLSDAFKHIKTCLDTLMKLRNAAGVGVPRPKDTISEMEENILWEKGMLGFKDPNTLCNTVLFMVGIHFRLRGGQEHRALRRYPKY